MKTVVMAKVLSNIKFSEGIYEMKVSAPEIAKEAKPGQFVNLYTGKGEMILPRPISICEIDKEQGILRILFQVLGKGTECFSTFKEEDSVKIMGPLGNGFTITEDCCKSVVVGGGIGVPPLLELVKNLEGKVQVFLGAKTNPILVEEFQKHGASVYVATDDGSCGFHGNVLELIRRINPTPDMIYACGPKVMLKAVAGWAKEKQLDAQVSMEERMACGIGACVGCAIKVKRKEAQDWENLKVCKDGPVFWTSEVMWDE